MCETGVLFFSAPGRDGRNNPPNPSPCLFSSPFTFVEAMGLFPSLSCPHHSRIGVDPQQTGFASPVSCTEEGCSEQTSWESLACQLSVPMGSAYPSALPLFPLPFPIPAPCLSPSLRHKLAGAREGDKACEMAGNLPTPACGPLAILLTSPSPERIDASAFELL